MESEEADIGRVVSIADGICLVSGLSGVSVNSVVGFTGSIHGLVIGFNQDTCDVLIFGDYTKIKKGDFVQHLDENLTIPVGEALLGRIIDPLGNPMDGKGAIETKQRSQYEAPAKNVFERTPIDRPLETGILMVDSQIPIGLGQRELFIGEKRIGKEEYALDALINQGLNQTNVCGIYCAIGSQTVSVKRVIERVKAKGVMNNTTIIVGRASDSAPLNYLAPQAAVTIAESYARAGRDVVIVFDNLTRHARVYRQISLLLKRAPGREAYPGDIFYLHSRLLERCGNFNEAGGGGSITAIPLVETVTEDITDYVTTNLMSITDGHVLFTKALYHKGIRPAISSEYSVSRVGGKAQRPVLRELSNQLRSLLGKYIEFEGLTAFGAELQAETAEIVDRSQRVLGFTNQDKYPNLAPGIQAIMIYFLLSLHVFKWPAEVMDAILDQFMTYMQQASVMKELNQAKMAASIEEVKPVYERLIAQFAADDNTLKPLETEPVAGESETIGELLTSIDPENKSGGGK